MEALGQRLNLFVEWAAKARGQFCSTRWRPFRKERRDEIQILLAGPRLMRKWLITDQSHRAFPFAGAVVDILPEKRARTAILRL